MWSVVTRHWPAGGVRRRAHALPGAVRAGDGDVRARARQRRRVGAPGSAGADHAQPAPGTLILTQFTTIPTEAVGKQRYPESVRYV